jgi:tryptophan synthase beta chain
VSDQDALRGFALLAKMEGIIPALESAHAVAWVADNAGRWKKNDVVLICVSGRGDKDVAQVMDMNILDL